MLVLGWLTVLLGVFAILWADGRLSRKDWRSLSDRAANRKSDSSIRETR